MGKKTVPSLDEWIREAKENPSAENCGMFLFHNGVVRATARQQVREGKEAPPVKGMLFESNPFLAEEARMDTLSMDGIEYARVWLNSGELSVGDDIMLVLIGGDTRPHVVEALQYLVTRLKKECVKEVEQF